MTMIIDGTNGLTFPDTSKQYNSYYNFKNRIINGAMVIDQRNAGASVTPNNTYILDRWVGVNSQTGKFTVQQNAGSVTLPTGYSNYLGVTSTSAYSVGAADFFNIQQRIEGYNIYDFGLGTSNYVSFTLSFWVRSSLTGTFAGSVNNNVDAFYPFTYTISSANTWEQKTITISGTSSGTWLKTSGIGLVVLFSLGSGSTYGGATPNAWTSSTNGFAATGGTSIVGTNGATFYITGVQLEKGTQATSFDYRPYGTELVLCKRYYDKTFAIGTAPAQNAGRSGALETMAVRAAAATGLSSYFRFSVPMRATPSTFTFYNPSAANGQARNLDTNSDCSSTTTDFINEIGGKVQYTLPGSTVSTNLISVHWSADAEL